MLDEATPVDTGVLERLLDIRQQQATFDGFCARVDQLKARHTDAVSSRVLRDYQVRLASLEDAAQPLLAQARVEHDRLVQNGGQVQQRRDAAALEKEELELRHEAGELDETQLQERLQDPERTIGECDDTLRTLQGLQARFAEVLVDRAPAAPVPPAPPAKPRIDETQVGSEPAGEARLSPIAAHGIERIDPGATRVLQPFRDLAMSPFSSDTVDLGLSSAAPAIDQAVAPEASLQVEVEGEAPATYVLGMATSIGRSDDNDIRISTSGVSRHHATVHRRGGGFVVQDAGSQNGTDVNGQRVESQLLVSGDLICIGNARVYFFQVESTSPSTPGERGDRAKARTLGQRHAHIG